MRSEKEITISDMQSETNRGPFHWKHEVLGETTLSNMESEISLERKEYRLWVIAEFHFSITV